MESRTIVVKNIEIGPGSGAGTGGGTGGGGGGRNPLAGLVRLVFRVVLVVLALAIVIPLVVLGVGCFLIAAVVGLLLWGMRRIFGIRGGSRISVSAGIPGAAMWPGAGTGIPGNAHGNSHTASTDSGDDTDNDGREGVRVKR
jgi:hypothetical protein